MIWVIGCKGMLGRELATCLEDAGIPYIGTDQDVSILDPCALRTYASINSPSWIVNCSAYTAVDKAEDEPEAAYALNRDGASNIAEIANELDIPIIHISTDYVFDGTSPLPLSEDAEVSPVSVYGKSKFSGEEALRSLALKHYIIRTAWLYGEYGNNFVHTMIKLMNDREEIKVVNDQLGSPTWTRDLASLIIKIIARNSRDFGTYHFSGNGQCTWYDFAKKIYDIGRSRGLIKSNCIVSPCTSDEFKTKAQRPAYSLLSKRKVENTYYFKIPDWTESLDTFINEIDMEKREK